MRFNRKGPQNGKRGSVTVEMTLVGLLFFVILTGIADLGQFLFIQEALVERARAAARWGAAHDPTDTAAITNMVLYFSTTAPPGGTPSFGLTPVMVHISTPDAGTDDHRLVVRISGYSYQVVSPYLASTYQGAPITVSVPLGAY